MGYTRRFTAVILSLLAMGGGIGAASLASERVAAAPHAECTFNPGGSQSALEFARRLSATAEVLAPSVPGRRRSVVPPRQIVSKNFIDDEIFGRMAKDGIAWTVAASDEEFLRRVTLDLTGQIPDVTTLRSFLADASPDKRDRAVDRLLASEEFVDRWTLWFGDLVQLVKVTPNTRIDIKGRNAYYTFIRDSIRTGKPYDQMVREVLAGNGSHFTVGPVSYWVRLVEFNFPIQDTYDNLGAFSAQQFLGLPLNCLSCHDGFHHLEQVNLGLATRKRTEFWQNAAFFAQVTVTNQSDPAGTFQYEYVLADNTTGAYRLNTVSGNKTPRRPVEGQPPIAEPAFFLSGETPRAGETRRQAYGRILTAHPQFARATVNRLWKELFGMAIVEPPESFDLSRQDRTTLPTGATLQPANPELLKKLADHFAANGYSLRETLKTMVSSNAYQLAAEYTPGGWKESWTAYFPRHYPRRLLSESVLDAVSRATGVPVSFTVAGLGTLDRAMALPDPIEPVNSPYKAILVAFGRGDRDAVVRSRDASIVQALLMLNDPAITSRVKAANNSTVERLLRSTTDPAVIADELYLATLSRHPTNAERQAAIGLLKSGDLTAKTEDLQFALLNRLEFLFN